MPQPRKAGSPGRAAAPTSGSGIADATSKAEIAPTVELVRGLAAVVADHGLTELIVALPNATITLRRGGDTEHHHHMVASSMPPAIHLPPPPSHASSGQFAAAAGGASSMPGASHAAPPPPPQVAELGHLVTSPFVGTFYRKPNPDSQIYANVGDRVEKGKTLCIIEAMKLMNEIEADVAGVIAAVLVEDGSPVEYGQALFRITPA